MTLLIVDDEYYLVQGLKNRIHWAEYGIDTVLEAYSAEQALEVYQDNRIDILLADVEMPRENGLSLIGKVIEQGYDSVNILLTGHADFNYAKEAIRLKVFDYLVKPIESGQLALVIMRAAEELERRRQQQKAALERRRERFWQLLYSGELPSENEEAVRSYLEAEGPWDISLDEHFYYSYLMVKRIKADISEVTSPEAAPAMQGKIRGLLSEDSCVAAADRRGYMISTRVVPGVSEEMLHARGEKLVKTLGDIHPDHSFVLYTFAEAPLLSAPHACELLSQYAMRILTTGNEVISVLSTDLRNRLEEDRKTVLIPVETWRERLLQGKTEDILFQVRSLLERRKTVYSARYLSMIFYGLLDTVMSVFADQKRSPAEMLTQVSHSSDFTEAARAPESLARWAENLLREADRNLKQEKEAGSLIEQIREYIDEHLEDPHLDRGMISAAVHISPDYLSYLFHKETGAVLSAYVTEKRIAAAKRLLLTTDLSLEEIGERTGFSNSTYFHRQFKKITGSTPSVYRKEAGKKQ